MICLGGSPFLNRCGCDGCKRVRAEARARGKDRAKPDDPYPDTAWMAQAACKNQDPNLWFREGKDGGGSGPDCNYGPARAVCGGCDVRFKCLEFALSEHIDYGMWGGLSPRERRRLKRNRVA